MSYTLMNHWPIHDFVTSCTGWLENIGSLSYVYDYTILKNHIC